MRASRIAMVVAAGFWCNVHAQTMSAAYAHSGLTSSPLEMPGLGRVLAAFIAVVALAVAIAMTIRRVSPWLPRGLQLPSAASVTVLARQRLEPGLRLFVVAICDERLAIIASRTAIAVHPLHGNAEPDSQSKDTGSVSQ